MPYIQSTRDALGVLKTHIETSFATTPPLEQGVDVVLLEKEQSSPEWVGKPTIVFSATDELEPLYGWYAHRVTATARVMASDSAGGLVGAANPDAAQEVLAKKLQQLIFNDYDALRELGLLSIEFKKGQSGKTTKGSRTQAKVQSPTVAYVETNINFVYLMDG